MAAKRDGAQNVRSSASLQGLAELAAPGAALCVAARATSSLASNLQNHMTIKTQTETDRPTDTTAQLAQ